MDIPKNYNQVTFDSKVFSGDLIIYYDEFNKMVGSGVLVKKQVDPLCPLTKSFYILKNINTGKCWKVNSRRYNFYHQPHKVKGFDFNELPAIKEIRNKLNNYL